MGRALGAVGGLLVLCFVILGVVVFLGRSEGRVAVDQVLAEDISRAFSVADGGPDPVELPVLTHFRWDRLLIVRRGTPRPAIDAALGFPFKGDLSYDAESQDLLIFADGDRLARFADYRGRGTFTGIRRPIARFTPAKAVFMVRGQAIRPR
jgi:hypothetical protein